MIRIKGAEWIAKRLRSCGVETVFGVPGQRVLPLFEALRANGIKIIISCNEQGASYMADSFARVNGFGVVITTSGPGAINALSGTSAAWMDSTPLLVLSAQAEVSEFGRYGIQEGTGIGRTPDILMMYRSCTKMVARPVSTIQMIKQFDVLVKNAQHGRPGPVFMDIPSNLFEEQCFVDMNNQSIVTNEECLHYNKDLGALAHMVAKELILAHNPLLLIGKGAGKLQSKLITLVKQFALTYATTFLAKGILGEKCSRSLGVVGSYGNRIANIAFHGDADLVLAIGVSFSWLTTAGWKRVSGRLIRCDSEFSELERHYTGDLCIHSDAEKFIDELLNVCDVDSAFLVRSKQSKLLNQKDLEDDVLVAMSGFKLHPVDVIRSINEKLRPEDIVVCDVGQFAYWCERYLVVPRGVKFIIGGGLGAMGHGVSGGVGAYLATSGRRTWVLCGDGGFLMNGMEGAIAARIDADVKYIVFNNGELGTQADWFRNRKLSTTLVHTPRIQFTELGCGLGLRTFVIRDKNDLVRRLASVRRGAELWDVRCAASEPPVEY